MHGSKIEMVMNLNVFPKGYIKQSNVKDVKIVGEVRKGIFSGPASIIIDGTKVC